MREIEAALKEAIEANVHEDVGRVDGSFFDVTEGSLDGTLIDGFAGLRVGMGGGCCTLPLLSPTSLPPPSSSS
jgi:hypothetical protein